MILSAVLHRLLSKRQGIGPMESSVQTLSESERLLVAGWAPRVPSEFCGCSRLKTTAMTALVPPLRGLGHSLAASWTLPRRYANGSAVVAPPVKRSHPRQRPQLVPPLKLRRSATWVCACGSGICGQATPDRPEAPRTWQLAQTTADVRAALRALPPVGENRSDPLGPGLLASGQIGMIIRQLQAYLAEMDAP